MRQSPHSLIARSDGLTCGSLAGCVGRYGSKDGPNRSGDGGVAACEADIAALKAPQDKAVTFPAPRAAGATTSAIDSAKRRNGDAQAHGYDSICTG